MHCVPCFINVRTFAYRVVPKNVGKNVLLILTLNDFFLMQPQLYDIRMNDNRITKVLIYSQLHSGKETSSSHCSGLKTSWTSHIWPLSEWSGIIRDEEIVILTTSMTSKLAIYNNNSKDKSIIITLASFVTLSVNHW